MNQLSSRIVIVASFALFGLLSLIASARDFAITLVGQFHSIGGAIEFLPGGYVVVIEEGKTKSYVLRGSAFVPPERPLAPALKDWKSFDWEAVDYLNQIDRKDVDPDLRALLPGAAKVKKVIAVNQPGGKTLSLVCYTTKTIERDASLDATDIMLEAIIDQEPDPHKVARYQKLWSKKLAKNVSYGELQYQSVPGAGDFVLLYAASLGGDSVDRALNIYKTTP